MPLDTPTIIEYVDDDIVVTWNERSVTLTSGGASDLDALLHDTAVEYEQAVSYLANLLDEIQRKAGRDLASLLAGMGVSTEHYIGLIAARGARVEALAHQLTRLVRIVSDAA